MNFLCNYGIVTRQVLFNQVSFVALHLSLTRWRSSFFLPRFLFVNSDPEVSVLILVGFGVQVAIFVLSTNLPHARIFSHRPVLDNVPASSGLHLHCSLSIYPTSKLHSSSSIHPMLRKFFSIVFASYHVLLVLLVDYLHTGWKWSQTGMRL